ncbi:Adenylate kinase OS=Streptomyces albaduncus OX=68172 GN=adk PE=3 SV=1 [Streptomyces griseoloalbus]
MDAGNLVPDRSPSPWRRTAWSSRTPRPASCWTAFQRNVSQAEALDKLLETEGITLDAVLDLEAPEAEVVKRIAGRRVCRKDSSHVFHVTYSPPAKEGVCDVCGGELYQRDDDSEETVRTRLEVYHTQTEPIIDYYKAQGLVVTMGRWVR